MRTFFLSLAASRINTHKTDTRLWSSVICFSTRIYFAGQMLESPCSLFDVEQTFISYRLGLSLFICFNPHHYSNSCTIICCCSCECYLSFTINESLLESSAQSHNLSNRVQSVESTVFMFSMKRIGALTHSSFLSQCSFHWQWSWETGERCGQSKNE